MKASNLIYIAGFIMAAGSAQTAPLAFKNCKSNIVTEVFHSCNEGEGGASTPCSSTQTKWGFVVSNMTIDSEKAAASATLIYTSVKGKVIKSSVNCTMGDDHWMECVSTKKVPTLGHLEITFNINGIAPGVYFADIFADATNVPVGGFQNTDDACEK
jgi:hypothetical protein